MKVGGRFTIYQDKKSGKTFLFFRRAHRFFFKVRIQASSSLRT